jgi:hypothetical protein
MNGSIGFAHNPPSTTVAIESSATPSAETQMRSATPDRVFAPIAATPLTREDIHEANFELATARLNGGFVENQIADAHAHAGNSTASTVPSKTPETPDCEAEAHAALADARGLDLVNATIADMTPAEVGDPAAASQERTERIRGELQAMPGVAQKEVPSRKTETLDKLKNARESLNAAKNQGVDLARRTFWGKIASAGLALAGVAVAAALTTISFGAATPLLAIACASFAVAAGDAFCAWKNYKHAETAARGQDGTTPLPMGNSCIANATYYLLVSRRISPTKAATIANGVSFTIGAGLSISGMALGFLGGGAPQAFDTARHVCSLLQQGWAAASIANYAAATTGAVLREKQAQADVGKLLRENLDEEQTNEAHEMFEQLNPRQPSSPQAIMKASAEQANEGVVKAVVDGPGYAKEAGAIAVEGIKIAAQSLAFASAAIFNPVLAVGAPHLIGLPDSAVHA